MDSTYRIKHLPVSEHLQTMSQTKLAHELRRGDVLIHAYCHLQSIGRVIPLQPWERVEKVKFLPDLDWLEIETVRWKVNQSWTPKIGIEEAFCPQESTYLMIQQQSSVVILGTGWTRKVNQGFVVELEPVQR